jgi:glycosyltransferase involved in cell wall biosynthesis
LKLLLLSCSDITDGAARAAYRLHRALTQNAVESRMRVRIKKSEDRTVEGPIKKTSKVVGLMRPLLGNLPFLLQKSSNQNYHSGNWFPSSMSDEINALAVDVVNLHWVAGETLSIEDIGRIRKPLVWSLHDMWPFCGAEHYAPDDESARWRSSYTRKNRPVSDSGIDLDRQVWQRKLNAWKRPMHVVAPSRWLADCARNSVLFRDWPVSVIPNVLDTKVYQPLDRSFCRQALGLPGDKKIILFGAIGGGRDPRKGYDLLVEALQALASQVDPLGFLCVVFGQSAPENPPALPFSTHWTGFLHDELTLSLLYNAADVMAVPSRQDNLPQTATEPQACGCPVVAFDCTGFRDVVVHQETGYLAHAFDTDDFAAGLHWILEHSERRSALGCSARERALRLWSPEVIVPQYLKVYESAIEFQDSRN